MRGSHLKRGEASEKQGEAREGWHEGEALQKCILKGGDSSKEAKMCCLNLRLF